jgi:hypothetical protein
MLLAVAQRAITRAEFLKLAQDEFDGLLDLLVGIFHDALSGKSYQAGGQTLDLFPTLHFTHPSRV